MHLWGDSPVGIKKARVTGQPQMKVAQFRMCDSALPKLYFSDAWKPAL